MTLSWHHYIISYNSVNSGLYGCSWGCLHVFLLWIILNYHTSEIIVWKSMRSSVLWKNPELSEMKKGEGRSEVKSRHLKSGPFMFLQTLWLSSHTADSVCYPQQRGGGWAVYICVYVCRKHLKKWQLLAIFQPQSEWPNQGLSLILPGRRLRGGSGGGGRGRLKHTLTLTHSSQKLYKTQGGRILDISQAGTLPNG